MAFLVVQTSRHIGCLYCIVMSGRLNDLMDNDRLLLNLSFVFHNFLSISNEEGNCAISVEARIRTHRTLDVEQYIGSTVANDILMSDNTLSNACAVLAENKESTSAQLLVT